MTTRKYSTYCAKAIAGIGRLPDTVADRSIPIRLRRRGPGEEIAEFDEEQWESEAASIARGLDDALQPHRDTLWQAKPQRPDGISDRAKDGWKPLLAIADLAGGEWPDRGPNAARLLCAEHELDEQEIGIRLIGALRDAFAKDQSDKLASSSLLEHLHAQKDEPWADWSRGNPISARKVADLLRPFEIKPRTIRIGESTAKGYELDRCEDAFARYLPSNRNTRNNGSSKPQTGISDPSQRGSMFRIENGRKPLEQADVTAVTDWDIPTEEDGPDPPLATPEEEARAMQLLTVSLDDEEPVR